MKSDHKTFGVAQAPPDDDAGLGLNPLPAAWRARTEHSPAATDHTTTDPEGTTSMNKAQLIDAVAPKTGGRQAATLAVETVLDAIVRAVAAGEAVSVTGFGTLVPKATPARVSRNPQTGGAVQVAPSRVVRFRPGVRFSDLVSGRKPMPASGNCIQKAPKTPRP